MRIFVFAFAAIAAASAASITSEYLTPVVDNSLISQEYLPPTQEVSEEPAPLADDGYRYKVVRKLKYRNRRDVSELSSGEYLPPVKQVAVEAAPTVEEAAFVDAPLEVASQESAVLADDGYRYKTVRRIRYRRRRDVNELASNEYLPPVAATQQETVVVEAAPEQAPVEAATQESAVLADDGYRYKTVRRIRYRRRRDVNELASNEYLPPVAATQQEVVAVESAPEQAPLEAAAQDSAVLADDGYRYKTVRRIRYRRRRDVNELASNEYLPPVAATQQETVLVEAAPEQAPLEAASQETAVLADDGYRYKTVRRIRYRRRRDVNELASNEYLPPVAATQQETVVAEAAPEQAPVAYEAPVEAASQETAVLADDGYRYKTVRRIRYRRRRDVNELASNEYLPPVAATQQETFVVEAAPEQAPVAYEAPVEAASQETAVLADDGYRYKTVRRIRYRRRRDVNELASNEYLPPVAATQQETVVVEAAPEQAPVAYEAPVEAASQETAVLADDGYRYKTVRRIRYRRRRDVNELASNEYLPPVAATQQETVVVEAAPEQAPVAYEAPVEAATQETAVLADDGYRYKTVRRIRYRRRRDVNELPANKYLPAVAQTQEVVVEAVPEQTTYAVEAPIEAAAQESAVLADDGYRYKTVRRIRYRHRRDVNELPSNEYLPPVEAQTQEIASVVSVPEATTIFGDDGYRYKTVRKLKYRRH